MSAVTLFAELQSAGVRLSLAGGDLRYQTRPGVSIAPYRGRIASHKPALLALLRTREPVAATALQNRNRGPVEATKPPAGWDGALCAGCRWERYCGVLGPRRRAPLTARARRGRRHPKGLPMIELRCRRCGAPFTPTKADLVKGPAWYLLCASCRLSAPKGMP